MSKLRNRNIRGKFRVEEDGSSRVASLSSFDSSDVEEFGNSFDRSSNSSISWAEDYELQATDVVRKEYERMERVLQCQEPIPPHYDRDEYKLWIKTFPCLNLTGQAPSEIACKSKLRASPDNRRICDKTTSAVSSSTSSVIDKLLGELYPSSKSSSRSISSKQSINNTLNPRTLNIKFDSFLQISPVKPTDPKKEAVSTWLSESNFKSLPNIPSPKKPTRRKRSSYHSHDHEISSDFIILPPIENRPQQNRSASSISHSAELFHKPHPFNKFHTLRKSQRNEKINLIFE